MADKPIGQLNDFPQVDIGTTNTLLVAQYGGAAYKLNGQRFVNALAELLDGHGGITSIVYTPPVAPSLVGTMTITLADETVTTVNVNQGKGISSISKQGTSGLVDTYRITYNDATTSTFTVTNGQKGDTGDSWYLWIRYASRNPISDSDISTLPDKWIGIYSGTSSTAPTHYTSYTWYQYKGDKGDTGEDATISSTAVEYQEGSSGQNPPIGTWTTTVPSVSPGNFLWTRTTIEFEGEDPIVFYSVSRYGIDGSGSVSTVNGVSPDGSGNIALVADDIPTDDSTSIQDRIDAIESQIGDVPSPSIANPLMDGTASAGTSEDYARGDHRHPSDSTKAVIKTVAENAIDDIGVSGFYTTSENRTLVHVQWGSTYAVQMSHLYGTTNQLYIRHKYTSTWSSWEKLNGVTQTGTLTAGMPYVTLNFPFTIPDDAKIDIYTDTFGVNPILVSVSGGNVLVAFPIQTEDVGVKVVVS